MDNAVLIIILKFKIKCITVMGNAELATKAKYREAINIPNDAIANT